MKRMLADVCPELINEWSQRNLPITPDSVTHGSNKIVWWKGKCGHEWRASVKNRVIGGSGSLPVCAKLGSMSKSFRILWDIRIYQLL